MKHTLALLALVLAACNPPTRPAASPTPTADPHRPLPPKHPAVPAGAPLGFVAPAGWTAETPSSNMRKAQYRAPGKDAKAADGQLVVFHFGSQSGTLEANVERWRGQFGGADAQTDKLEGALLPTTLVDIRGDYSGDMGGDPVPGARMLLAVVETGDGAWYFKFVGPAATVEHWKGPFLDAVKVLKAKKGA